MPHHPVSVTSLTRPAYRVPKDLDSSRRDVLSRLIDDDGRRPANVPQHRHDALLGLDGPVLTAS